MEKKQTDLSRRSLLTLAGAAAATVTGGCGGASAATTTPTAKLFYTESSPPATNGSTNASNNSNTNANLKSVMLLHGWTCDSHDWSWQLPALESKYRVVAVDLRGHGASEVMPAGSYSPDDYLSDIEALITTKYPGQKFILIGHSMGGQIAARLAAKRADLVNAVVSIDGSLGFSAGLGAVFQQVTDDLNNKDPGLVGPALFEQFYDASTSQAFRRWHARRLQGAPLQVVRESFGPLFLGAKQVGVGKQSEDFCRSLALPFYHLCRFPDQAAAMSTWFSNPKSKVELWGNAGHWLMQDRIADINTAVTAWIDAL